MSEWIDCPLCGQNHENLCKCPEPRIAMSEDEKQSLVESDFMTDPLVGMLSKPAHLLSDAELDAFVAQTRQARNSTQMLKAAMAQDAAKVKVEKVAKKEPKVEKVDTKALDDLLFL